MTRLWERLGAHPEGDGWRFAVWAPNARAVTVVGDFTGWWPDDGVPMDQDWSDGVWRAWVPSAASGQRYRFRVLGADGEWRHKSDPLAFATECPPANASVLHAPDYAWGDGEWMRTRRGDHHALPMSVYEVHLASWRPGLSYRDLATQLVDYVGGLGFTHVEFMPVMEHPFGGSWGYQVTGFYAPTARLGSPDDFRHLVDAFHRAGIGVILDWVPAHFPKDEWALATFDGTHLYEHPDPRRGEHPDWGSLIFNYGRDEVRDFLVSNARFWCEEFHVDGLRVDAVASLLYLDYSRQAGEWEPNVFGGNTNLEALAFIKELNGAVYAEHPGVVMIAEESTAWPGVSRPLDWGGLGFGLKWNMGWMHDTLGYIEHEPIHRRYHHDELTLPSLYAFDEQFVLPISHDEVVHGKKSLLGKLPGDHWQQLAGLRGLLGYMWAFPGKKLIFMGAELAATEEWSEQRGLDWSHPDQGVIDTLRDANRLLTRIGALSQRDGTADGFAWLSVHDADRNVIAFTRFGDDGSMLACVVNFSGIPVTDYELTLPAAGTWTEVLNTDAAVYCGSNVGNYGEVVARPEAKVHLGPFAAVWLTR
ncbi:1,4-alpha-glucan branching enzyme [Allocatelliglobosispora scoriae]|uniref:1,4-alpha-glucan branching enzyme GlgB n=1 Tax=Allocatelliglobosispora scoriae TaxID=643052 RepID=A0A841BUM0_9ACTN|nr:1,4-alpha-glucan branching protein GlgB [Allocatelliglobosispora scoriae]MBB5872817.1 1,4-alpha-glucan branching enzyme [Allocatelliglobosispora scoriae]